MHVDIMENKIGIFYDALATKKFENYLNKSCHK